MVYKVIGLMSGSSLDGLDLAYVHLQERAVTAQQPYKQWEYHFVHTDCYPYPPEWRQRLAAAPGLSALDYQLLHTEYGHYLGGQVNRFIEEYHLHYQVQLIASHGHTAFHLPAKKMTAQLGDGAAIAAETRINVVSDLRAIDLALGGQGAPIVPIGELLMLPEYEFFLNLGGIANISAVAVNARPAPGAATNFSAGAGAAAGLPATAGVLSSFIAFDVCPANRVLNALAALEGMAYDDGGALAATGRLDEDLLEELGRLPYYEKPYPKSLANEFGDGVVYPMIREAMIRDAGLGAAGALRTYTEHIVLQIEKAIRMLAGERPRSDEPPPKSEQALAGKPAPANESAPGSVPASRKMLVTGGGANNLFLVGRLQELLTPLNIEVVVPDAALVNYKEALVMAFIGVLRWREENNVLASVTGASRDSIGGAVWIGSDA